MTLTLFCLLCETGNLQAYQTHLTREQLAFSVCQPHVNAQLSSVVRHHEIGEGSKQLCSFLIGDKVSKNSGINKEKRDKFGSSQNNM